MHPPFCYPFFLSKLTGCEFDNKGRNGASSVSWWNDVKPTVDTTKNFDTVYIYLGTNGGLGGDISIVALGTDYRNYDTTTKMGAYCAIVSWVKETFSNAKIFLINFPIGKRGETWSRDMSILVGKVSTKFNVPVIDMFGKSPFRQDDGRMYRPVGMDEEISATGSSNGNLHYGKLGYLTFAKWVYNLTSEIVNKNKTNYSL